MEVEFVKFNRGRKPEFQTETSIVRDNGERFVRKKPLVPEAEGHVASLLKKFELLHGLKGVKANRPHLRGERVVFAFVEGDSFEDRMLDRLSRGDKEGFKELLDRYLELLRSYGPIRSDEYRPGRSMSQIFSKGFVLSDEPCLPVTNLDLTFDNLIIDHNDEVWVTDYEWVYDEPVPLSFIIFRSLYVFLLRASDRHYSIDERELIAWARIDPKQVQEYREACERFIDLVYGKERQFLIPSSFRQKVHTLGPGEELADSNARLAQAKEELSSAYTMLRERAEEVVVLRSSLDELRSSRAEIEASVRRQASELVLLQRSLEQQIQHIDGLKDQITTRDNTIIDLTSSFNDQITTRDNTIIDLTNKKKEETERLLEQVERKQKELMAMSDWAYGMKQRLEFIDSSPSVIRAERRARNYREARAMFKANGFSGLFNGFLRRYRPGWAAHGHVHEVPADVEELAMNVRTNRGNLLVVFPIIPWEFRWQRPQQLVSRFAKDGSSVLFINMSLTPKGRRFKDEKDAGKDVKIGKLDDNIYQVWLSSEGRLNIYQDRMSEGDVSNLLNGLRFVLDEADASSIHYAVQFPGWADLAIAVRKKVKGKLIFDSMDEHSGFSNNAEAVLRDEEKLLRQSNLVITTSSKLHTKAVMHAKEVVMVRNGTDFEFFNKLVKNGELDGINGPIIGYYGAISDWFDADIIESCARSRPEWTFVLIGSTVGSKVDALEKLPNVRFLGEKPYKTLPGFLAYFDVCIIPFKINQLTLATNPVKFYEYLSSGKPVVSVPLPELLEFKDLCYLADGPKEFEESIVKALREDDQEIVSRRIAFAKENSWDDRYRRIKMALDDI